MPGPTAPDGEEGIVTYFHNDIAGTPMLETDANGNVVWKESYYPYGDRLKREAASSDNALWFTGKPSDDDTGLSYMGARYYDPVIGRFMGVDPKEVDPGDIYTFNRYAYANDNPYKYVDPDGRVSLFALAVGAIIVAGVEVYVEAHSPPPPGCGSDCVAPSAPIIAGIVGAIGVASPGAGRIISGIRQAAGVTKGAGRADDFFKGTKYTDKVKAQMKQGDFHSFPESVKGFQDAGKVSKLKGGDGVVRDKLEIPGGYRGREGKFEFIKEPDGTINHRLFRPDKE